jgi:hypothetical protein
LFLGQDPTLGGCTVQTLDRRVHLILGGSVEKFARCIGHPSTAQNLVPDNGKMRHTGPVSYKTTLHHAAKMTLRVRTTIYRSYKHFALMHTQ